jgi:transcriptional regulator of NAD metabolism
MDAVNRRKKIMEVIKMSDGCVTGSELSAMLDVTRQVVVQDIALLRAGGIPIIATPSGYMLLDTVARARPLKVFTCRHETLEQAEAELTMIVESGGKVRDVIIEHPVYGEISGALMVSTMEAVKNLIERLRRKDSLMLTSITAGVHMHTVEAADEETLLVIEKKLRDAGILI